MADYEKYDPALYQAPPGKYRVVDIDIWVVDGFSGQLDEQAGYLIGDYRWLWMAKLVANYVNYSRFPRQIHNNTGDCIYHSVGEDFPIMAKTAQFVFAVRGLFARARYKVKSFFRTEEDYKC